MTDHLAALPIAQVAGWYRRLAERIAGERVGGQQPMAATFLFHYLENRDSGSLWQFAAPTYLQQSSFVLAVLRYHRSVLLTQERARIGGRQVWAGVIPRIQGLAGFTRWDLQRPLDMTYESLVEVGSSALEIGRIQLSGTPEERDILTSLRGFQLRSRVTIRASRLPNDRVTVSFATWMARVSDRYDFDYSEHFMVPNPDFGSTATDAVRPQDENLTVYHSNARRLEHAGRAAPYNLQSHEWRVADARLAGPAEIDPRRRL